ncbi:hypothetical protein BRD18_03135 [Halobacteriales archaeon SW_7_71_33]|nr:MAG: hypothetical protein BRD18_03135 [Halobacteriales archaeon SW_7_71_33]
MFAGAPDLARSLVEDLRAEYGPVEVNAEREWYAPEHHDPDAFAAPDGLYRYASVWCRRDGAVLLVRPSVDEGWCPPGGTWETGESLAETARRETSEETGIEVAITGVLEARLAWTGYADLPGDGGAVDGRDDVDPREDLDGDYSLGAIFHAEAVGGDLRPEPDETDAAGWFSAIPDRENLVFERTADYPEP